MLNFLEKIQMIDGVSKFDADKALVYFSVSGHSGHFLDMRGFETSASIENIQIQLMKTGSSAAHGKIALPLYAIPERNRYFPPKPNPRLNALLFLVIVLKQTPVSLSILCSSPYGNPIIVSSTST